MISSNNSHNFSVIADPEPSLPLYRPFIARKKYNRDEKQPTKLPKKCRLPLYSRLVTNLSIRLSRRCF